jgi:myo-inositol-hexaphosphate 3-phosphohydrolase
LDTLNKKQLAPATQKEQLLRDSLRATVSVFPNPTQDMIHVTFTDKEEHTLTVYDLNGKMLRKVTAVSKAEVDISDQKYACYILEIETHGQQVQWKILKQ